MRVFSSILIVLFTGASPAAFADTLFGVYAGAGSWNQSYSGDITSGITDVKIEDDLSLGDERNNLYYVAIEHFVPMLPNLRLQRTEMSTTGFNMLTRTIDFNGASFAINDAVSTDVQLDQTDAVLYYEVLDNVVSLDVGLAVRRVDGFFEVVSSLDSARAEFDGFLPLVYGKARVDLPFSGFWAGAELMGIRYGSDQLLDANVKVAYESDLGVGAELGWRTYRLDFQDLGDLDDASIEVSGPYAALNYHF